MLIVFFFASGILIVGISLSLAWIIISMITLVFTRVPYVNTPRKYCRKIMENINVSGLTVYDLGCGDAYFLRKCAERGAKKCLGYELSPMAYLSATAKTLIRPVIIRFGDFFKADISQADVIYIYLVKTVLAKLASKLKSEAKPGAKIITVGSPLTDWKPEKIIILNENNYCAYIYIK